KGWSRTAELVRGLPVHRQSQDDCEFQKLLSSIRSIPIFRFPETASIPGSRDRARGTEVTDRLHNEPVPSFVNSHRKPDARLAGSQLQLLVPDHRTAATFFQHQYFS